jgi:diguanylate cyclase (GGDEF)-like protein
MIDIDFFKKYNDLLGHLEGDECLKKIASTLGRHLRADMDLIARYGGEEFVAVLPETSTVEARKVAERIRRDIESLRIPHPSSPVSRYVTVSIGVASMVPMDNLKKEVLLNMADKALYIAKNKGRNRIEVFTPKEEKVPDSHKGVE